MVYAASPWLKRQVDVYILLETVEAGMGWLLLSVLTIGVGALGQFMTAWIFWTGVAMSVLEGSSKYLRGRIHRFFFHVMSCCQVSTAQGTSYRYKLGTCRMLGGRFRVTFAYVLIIAIVRLLVMGLQLGFGIHMHTRIHDFKKNPDFDEDMGNKRVVESIHCTFYFLVLHSAMVVVLKFFSFFKALLCPLVSWICGTCWKHCCFCGGCWKGGCCGRTYCRGEDDCSSLTRGPLMERVGRTQRAMEMGVTWYVHRHRHRYFTAVEAQANEQECGLQGYWFLSVKDLVKQVGDHLADLADENRYAASKRRGRKVGKELTMALESLLELSREQTACDCGDDSSTRRPATSRTCLRLVVAGTTWTRVLNSCPEDSDDVHLAASILSGFAASLSVLTWQPGQSQEIVQMLEHEDFRCCTRQVLWRLGKLMQRTLRAPAGSAQCQASMIAPHAGSAQGNGILNGEDELKKHTRMLSNAFTTFCSLGWFLDGQFPPIQAVSDGWFQWLQTVWGALTDGSDGIILKTLLDCASRPSDFPRKVVADSMRTLFSLFSRRMIYWHRFDMRHAELPEPFIHISSVKASANLREGLESLVVRCCDEDDPLFSVSVFSKLQLAKMAISQDIRDNDEKVVQVLLLCLSYWRRALGAKELDWLACETVEMLRDVVSSSHNPAEIGRFIADSPGGLECLTLMLQPRFPRIAAIRIDTEQDTSDAPVAPLSGDGRRAPSAEGQVIAASSSSSASKGACRNLFRRVTDASWAGDEQVSIRYSAPAAGLLQDIITTTSGGDRETRDLLNQNFSAFLFSLMQVLMNLTNVKTQGQRSAEAQRCCCGSAGTGKPGKGCAPRWCQHFLARIVLLFLESLGHPAWHPPCPWLETISSVSEGEQDNQMEHLEQNVNILLGARNALRLLNHLIDSRWEKLSEEELDLLRDRLVPLCQVPAPQLHLVLTLPDWNVEIKNTITRLLEDINSCIQDDNGDQLSHNRRQKGKGRGRGKLLPVDGDQTRKSRSMELATKQNVSSAEDTNQGDAADAAPSGRPSLSTDGIDKSMQQASSSGDARDAGPYDENTSAQQSQHGGELGSGSTSAQHSQETSDSTSGVPSTESSTHDASQARRESGSAQDNSCLTRLSPVVSGQADTSDPGDENGKRLPLLA
ncbi:hypothetical protein CBR_g55431 [Chara braunii]|uniref:Uncharacterized protein n=1 Tax=Chara braunii TaxID=69332 RepID=A0A388K7R6_CHABU|nr:hypothetical protein CBR_g55431 [Chara braunii]|eukprot:GBG66088.1 hypothetical protein CBR_g55431 [Chara braunii]